MDHDERQERVVGGRYRLHGRLGAGAMGTVWRADDLVLDREVAVKEVVLPPGTRPEEAEVLRERTRREARSAARLHHPSVVAVYDVVEEDGRPWLVMELVEARTLAEVVSADGPLSPVRVAQVGLAVLDALEVAHGRGIVHRDVKPGNVMLCEPERGEGRVVLTDFGIATVAGDSSITSTGMLLGSPAYIAPERARGHAPGPHSDLWSLGATLFTAVEGRPPYDGADALETVTAVVTGEHAPYTAAGPLTAVLDGLLAKDPADRLGAAQARALLGPLAAAQVTSQASQAAPDPVGPAPARAATPDRTAALDLQQVREEVRASRAPGKRPARPRRSTRVPVAAKVPVAAAAVLLALAGGAWFALDGQERNAGEASPAPTADAAAPAALPEGWQVFTDPAGWSLGLPAGFVDTPRSERPDERNLRNDELRMTLRVYVEDPQPAVERAEALTAAQSSLTGYDEVAVRETDYRGWPAVEHEFTYYSGTELHTLERVVSVGDESYRLYWQTNADDFAESLPVFEAVASTFDPST